MNITFFFIFSLGQFSLLHKIRVLKMAVSSDNDYEYGLFHNDSDISMDHAAKLSAFQIYTAVCTTIIFCISMPGNSFLLSVLMKEHAWMTISDVLLLQFTVSNLIFTVTLPFLACNLLHEWIFGEWTCGVMRGFSTLGYNSSVMILTAMTVHSYVTVLQTSCLSALNSSKFRVLVACTTVWIVCAVVSIKLAVKSRVIIFELVDIQMCMFDYNSLNRFIFDMHVEIWFFFVIPFLAIGFCNVYMWLTLKQHGANNYPQPSKLIFWLTVVFFLCLLPFNIETFVESLMAADAIAYSSSWRHAMHYVGFIIFTLSHFYCCLNPLFHMFGTQRFRRHFPTLSFFSSQSGESNNNATSVRFQVLDNSDV